MPLVSPDETIFEIFSARETRGKIGGPAGAGRTTGGLAPGQA